MSELELRTPTVEDAAAIAALCNALSRELYDAGDVDEQAVREWFAMSDLGMLLAEADGRAVGYADVRDDDHVRFPIDLRVDPSAWGSGVAGRLLDAAERWARERAAPGAVARGYAPERDTEVQGMLAAAGYRLIRHSFVMEIDLGARPEAPVWPEGIAVRTYDPEREEAQAVHECLMEAFADHWDFHPLEFERWRAYNVESETFDPSLWWLAESDGELAAICLCARHFSGDPELGWVNELGVRRPWRRRGLGRALLLQAFAEFARRGAKRVGLGVDAENTTGAVRLYERAGMRPVRRNDSFEKAL
jgi:mycothiol synthase